MSKKITIAIDGHAACGKSTLAKALAKALNYTFIDSGAMYRAVALYYLNHGGFSENGALVLEQIESQLGQIHIEISKEQRVLLNNQDITQDIRLPKVAAVVSKIATIKNVRKKLVECQQQLGKNGGIVMDGRDIGTVVFPDAELKIFVTASIAVRTKRRLEELAQNGDNIDAKSVEQNLLERDHIDSNRQESPLQMASDAIVLDTSSLSKEEQLNWALERVALLVSD